MVTLRSGKAVPYLGKNVPKRKTAKKTKKNRAEKSNDSKPSKNLQMTPPEEEIPQADQTTTFAAAQPVVFDVSNPLPVDDSNEVSLNDISGTTNQSKRSVLDESSDDSAETMIDDSFEITDYDCDQHDLTENDESFTMQEPAVRICLPVRGTTNDGNKEPNVSRAEGGADDNDDDEVKRKPLTDLCSVTNISWF